ncbi:hypothetical protein GCM10010331_45280 [Streptomyces xanthochromogenes]|uniref:MerR family transcriptional regulator n=1 Tax=Streptomyces xanthochromogenes TaxID=67384 RepID=UPI0016767F8A|nr:MerR family transcriptional regulator [Streptomyces xanthochromogenes]GHB52591.1 hypothetical protein GCM10010331_45280 [Streptomyces xanthochromogenes]
MRDWEREFAVIAGGEAQKTPAYYPGSSRRIRSVDPHTMRLVQAEPAPEVLWDSRPRVYRVGGRLEEFFSIGQLAQALNRQPVTIRKWERLKVIPAPTFSIRGKTERGNRRLYTRAQVEGMIRIAAEEGILLHEGESIHISTTDFSKRVVALFKELAAAAETSRAA